MGNPLRTIWCDFKGCFDRDPATKTPAGFLEVIFLYPGFHAILAHRFNHFLYQLKVPFIPRLLSQIVRFFTGIEIHPGARIGCGFFVDHGMGVVIGETTEIGRNVTLYQGVTLGGTGIQRGKRHPTLGDNVVVGAGAKVLGNIHLGNNVKVGAGSVVVHPVPDNCTVVGVPAEIVRKDGQRVAGISLDHGDLPDPVRELKNRVRGLQKEVENLEGLIRKYHEPDTKNQKSSPS